MSVFFYIPAVLASYLLRWKLIRLTQLHRTRLYVVLAVAVSIGAFVLQLFLRSEAFPYILIYMSLVYWILAPLVYRHAASFSRRSAA
jgi:hypothetical protein